MSSTSVIDQINGAQTQSAVEPGRVAGRTLFEVRNECQSGSNSVEDVVSHGTDSVCADVDVLLRLSMPFNSALLQSRMRRPNLR